MSRSWYLRIACCVVVALPIGLSPATSLAPAHARQPAAASRLVQAASPVPAIASVGWGADAGDLDDESNIGKTFTFVCPTTDDSLAELADDAHIEGFMTYTVDSDVCTAAVQTGELGNTAADLLLGGIVTIQIGDPVDQFVGSTQNNITSVGCSCENDVSYTIVGASQGAAAAGAPDLPIGGGGWDADASDLGLRRKQGNTMAAGYVYVCPPGGAAPLDGDGHVTVWGGGDSARTYSSDSSVCTAAVHAGLLTFANGGYVTIQITPGDSELYVGSSQNGVTTQTYDSSPSYPGFNFAGTTPQASATPTATQTPGSSAGGGGQPSQTPTATKVPNKITQLTGSASPYQTWKPASSGTTNDLYGVACATPVSGGSGATCVAVGSNGTIVHSTDSGQSWTADTYGAGTDILNGIACLSDHDCVAVGNGGLLLRGDPAKSASTWSKVTSHTTDGLYGINCTAVLSNCTAVGANGTFVNGAPNLFKVLTWTAGSTGKSTVLWGVACPIGRACMLVSQDGQIFSADGWRAVYSEPYYALKGIACPSGGYCVAVGGAGMALRTTDGGAHWSSANSGTSNALNGIACPDAQTCVVAGLQGTVAVSTDGGATWQLGSSITTWVLHGVACLPDGSTCVAVGDHGTIFSSARTAGGQIGATGSLSAGATGPENTGPSIFVDFHHVDGYRAVRGHGLLTVGVLAAPGVTAAFAVTLAMGTFARSAVFSASASTATGSTGTVLSRSRSPTARRSPSWAS